MDKKKTLLIFLILLWIVIFIVIQFDNTKEVNVQIKNNAQTNAQKQPILPNFSNSLSINYPEVSLRLVKKDLFGELVRPDIEKQKQEKERKKVVTLQVPPLPILPEEPKPKIQEKEEPINELKDIQLIGIFKKDGIRTAFFKKSNDVKAFKAGDVLFNTTLKIAEVDENSVILLDEKGKKKTLTVEKR
jgi:hypothetical protein